MNLTSRFYLLLNVFLPSNNATIMFLSLFIILHTCEKQTSTAKKNKFVFIIAL